MQDKRFLIIAQLLNMIRIINRKGNFENPGKGIQGTFRVLSKVEYQLSKLSWKKKGEI